MKTLNLLQNMSAEAKVLAMALPMLLLGAMSAMAAVKDPGRFDPSQMDMHFMVTQPGDTARVKPVDYPDGSRLMQPLPGQKPEGAGSDYIRENAITLSRYFQPVSPDSVNVEPAQQPDKNALWENLPSQKPEGAGLDYTISPGIPSDFMPSKFPQPFSPDSVNVEPAQQPDSDKLKQPIPNMNGGDPEEDRLISPGIPDDDDVYESFFIESIYNDQAGIEEVAVDNQPAQAAQGVFTLSGLLVSSNADLSGLAPGLYIVNGKKILVK